MSPRLRVRMASCWSLLCLVIERRANRSRGSHGGTKARSLGSDVVDVCVLTISINFNPAALLFLSRESTMNHKKAPTDFQSGLCFELYTPSQWRMSYRMEAAYIMPPMSGIAGAALPSSGASVIMHSVVRSRPATEPAFCNAVRVTMAGSTIPAARRSTYSPVATL